MLKGFKEFISQGNVIELAVAVIIGNAFKPIVDSVTKFILDIIGALVGSPNFDSVAQFKIREKSDYIQPGTILTAVINFLIVAAAVYFFVVVPMNKLAATRKKEEEAAPAKPTEAELLTEIRDLLATRRG